MKSGCTCLKADVKNGYYVNYIILLLANRETILQNQFLKYENYCSSIRFSNIRINWHPSITKLIWLYLSGVSLVQAIQNWITSATLYKILCTCQLKNHTNEVIAWYSCKHIFITNLTSLSLLCLISICIKAKYFANPMLFHGHFWRYLTVV